MSAGRVACYASGKSGALCQREAMELSMVELRVPLGGRCVGCEDTTLGLCGIQVKKSVGPLGTGF